MSKRGLSTEEKRKRMLEFFHEKQEFFQLKDMEKLCSAEKGITVQTIKDVLTSLVDDGLVESEKIDTSIYYWSLPSKALMKRKENIKTLESELKHETERNKLLNDKLDAYRSTSNDEDDDEKRAQLLEQLEELDDEKRRLEKELAAYRENDPEVFEKLKQTIQSSKKACNRWVENIFLLKSWLKNKFRVDEAVIDKQFEIPADLDYIN